MDAKYVCILNLSIIHWAIVFVEIVIGEDFVDTVYFDQGLQLCDGPKAFELFITYRRQEQDDPYAVYASSDPGR